MNTGTGNRILSPLDVRGEIRVGATLASPVQGRDLLVSRYTTDDISANGTTAASWNIISTRPTNSSLALGYGVRSATSTDGWISSLPSTVNSSRSALVVGVSGSNPSLVWKTSGAVSPSLGGAVSLSDTFSIVGSTACFSGTVAIGTNTPGASLDVNGTLKVGDFGGATNVMVKPRNTTPGVVGYVQPFYFAGGSGGITSNGIPAGTWFVYGQWVENTNDAYDNDPTTYMAKVWTVPPGKYLHIASDNKLWSTTDAGNGGKINLHWKMSDNATESISGAVGGWGAGWNTFVIPPTSNPSATTVGSDTVTAMSGYVFGYAEYDTYGVRGLGNNTPLGPGYGYIQRLA